jgi:hypothetical protein
MYSKYLLGKKVQCVDKEEVEIDNPAFGQMDPHLKFDDTQQDFEEQMIHSKNAVPSFD